MPSLPLRALLLCLPLVALLISGCATTQARIDKNQEYFAQLAPEKQQQIREGTIALGFSKDDVYLALGQPDAKYTRTTEAGESVIWAYRTGDFVSRPWWGHGYRGYYSHRRHWRHAYYGSFHDPYYSSPREARDRLRVIFNNGKVDAIEQVQE